MQDPQGGRGGVSPGLHGFCIRGIGAEKWRRPQLGLGLRSANLVNSQIDFVEVGRAASPLWGPGVGIWVIAEVTAALPVP